MLYTGPWSKAWVVQHYTCPQTVPPTVSVWEFWSYPCAHRVQATWDTETTGWDISTECQLFLALLCLGFYLANKFLRYFSNISWLHIKHQQLSAWPCCGLRVEMGRHTGRQSCHHNWLLFGEAEVFRCLRYILSSDSQGNFYNCSREDGWQKEVVNSECSVDRPRTTRIKANICSVSWAALHRLLRDVCFFVGCLTSQQYASVSQGRICTVNLTCCNTETEIADQTINLTQSQYTDTGLTSPSADPITPGAWQGRHWSASFWVNGMTRPRSLGWKETIIITIIIIMIIALKGAIWDFYNPLTMPWTVSNMYAQVAHAQQCVNHMQHIRCSSHATHRVPRDTKGQLSYHVWQSLKSYLFLLHFTGWTINQWRREGNRSTHRKPLMMCLRKCHILKPENSSPNWDLNRHSSTGGTPGKQSITPCVALTIRNISYVRQEDWVAMYLSKRVLTHIVPYCVVFFFVKCWCLWTPRLNTEHYIAASILFLKQVSIFETGIKIHNSNKKKQRYIIN